MTFNERWIYIIGPSGLCVHVYVRMNWNATTIRWTWTWTHYANEIAEEGGAPIEHEIITVYVSIALGVISLGRLQATDEPTDEYPNDFHLWSEQQFSLPFSCVWHIRSLRFPGTIAGDACDSAYARDECECEWVLAGSIHQSDYGSVFIRGERAVATYMHDDREAKLFKLLKCGPQFAMARSVR